jgi:hypothetical protein
LLGQWLVQYEPAATTRLRKTRTEASTERSSESGPRWSVEAQPGGLRSGTNG